MGIHKRAAAAAAMLATLTVVTAVLWYVKRMGIGADHPVFFYLLPIALLAFVYGSLPGMVCAAAAALIAAFFLYDPLYSFQVASPLEVGELIWFVVLALIGVKCTVALFRPTTKIRTQKSRYGQV
jgi:K+-sensing histidine kinase KdpD